MRNGIRSVCGGDINGRGEVTTVWRNGDHQRRQRRQRNNVLYGVSATNASNINSVMAIVNQ